MSGRRAKAVRDEARRRGLDPLSRKRRHAPGSQVSGLNPTMAKALGKDGDPVVAKVGPASNDDRREYRRMKKEVARG